MNKRTSTTLRVRIGTPTFLLKQVQLLTFQEYVYKNFDDLRTRRTKLTIKPKTK